MERNVILAVASSLDAKIEGPNGEFDWCFTDQDYGMNEFMSGIDTIFMGRKSYELMIRMEESGESENPYKSLDTYVFTNSLTQVKEGYSIISGDFVDKVKSLKKEDGKDIWLFGGTSLTTSFINSRLLDSIWLTVHPLLLGPGKPLFNDLAGRVPLKLISEKSYSTGLVSLTYAVENIKDKP